MNNHPKTIKIYASGIAIISMRRAIPDGKTECVCIGNGG